MNDLRQNLFRLPLQARAAKLRFVNADGDHLTLLNLFRAYMGEGGVGGGVGAWCLANYINRRGMKRAVDIYRLGCFFGVFILPRGWFGVPHV